MSTRHSNSSPDLAMCLTYGTREKDSKYVQQYLLMGKLGEGCYGKVREAMHSETLKRVAIKILKKAKIKKIRGGEEGLKNEIRIMRKIGKHKNVIELMDVIDENDKIYIVLEMAGRGSLETLMKLFPEKKLPMALCRYLFRQLIEGLEHLHNLGIIHRDIKPDNIMLTRDLVIKICDFGVCEELDMYSDSDTCTRSLGCPAFQPPQIASGREAFSGFKLDVWAAGVTLYLMVTGSYPFAGNNVFSLLENIAKAEYTIPQWVPEELRSLIRGLLDPNESTRLTIGQIKAHPWLAETVDDSVAINNLVKEVSPGLGGNTASSTRAKHNSMSFFSSSPSSPGNLNTITGSGDAEKWKTSVLPYLTKALQNGGTVLPSNGSSSNSPSTNAWDDDEKDNPLDHKICSVM